MKKIIFFIGFILFAGVSFGQMINFTDTIVTPVGTDTLYYGTGYTSNIIGVLMDCRAVAADDSTGFRVNIGTGWSAYDTTFIQFTSDALPAVLSGDNDYLIGFEKIGQAFQDIRIKVTGGDCSAGIKIPIRFTFDR